MGDWNDMRVRGNDVMGGGRDYTTMTWASVLRRGIDYNRCAVFAEGGCSNGV